MRRSLAVPGIVQACKSRQSAKPYPDSPVLPLACGLFVGLAILRTHNYRGDSFGVRGFATIMLSQRLPVDFVSGDMRTNPSFGAAFLGRTRPVDRPSACGVLSAMPSRFGACRQTARLRRRHCLARDREAGDPVKPLGRPRLLAVIAAVYVPLFLLKRRYDWCRGKAWMCLDQPGRRRHRGTNNAKPEPSANGVPAGIGCRLRLCGLSIQM